MSSNDIENLLTLLGFKLRFGKLFFFFFWCVFKASEALKRPPQFLSGWFYSLEFFCLQKMISFYVDFLVSEYYLCDVLDNGLLFSCAIMLLNLVLHVTKTFKSISPLNASRRSGTLFQEFLHCLRFSRVSFAKVSPLCVFFCVLFPWEIGLPFFNWKWKFWNKFKLVV